MTVTTFTIYGFQGCKYFNGAIELMKTLVIKNPKKIKVIVKQVPYSDWIVLLDKIHKTHKTTEKHTTSPLIMKEKGLLGGYDSLKEYIQKHKLL